MNIVDPEITSYLEELAPARPPALQEMEEYASQHDFPIIGPQVGHFLQQLVVLADARRIFEMGSGYGYSALWMALAMADDGRIECSEFDPDNIARGKKWLAQAGVDTKVSWHDGDARDAIRAAAGPFDIIVNDIDKQWYPEALRLAWPKLRPGGIMVTDNALWSGRVVSESPPQEWTTGVLQVNRDAYGLSDGIASVLPLRDGLLLVVKKR